MLNLEKEPESLLKVNELLRITQNENIFKKDVKERAKKVGRVRYIGWKREFYKRKDKLVMYVNLYFLVKGEKHKTKKGIKQYDYMIIVEFPYYKNIRTFKKLYDNTPFRFFASDPSFFFFGDAYILHQYGALLDNRSDIKAFTHYAITHPPKKRNPNEIPYFTKHAFKTIFKWLFNEKPARILDKKRELQIYPKIPISWAKELKLKM